MAKVWTKHNTTPHADALLREAEGLEALRCAAAGTGIAIPDVLRVGTAAMALTAIVNGHCRPAQWAALGAGLAAIHARPQSRYGFVADNYIGRNPQPNGFSDSWGAFFVERRLRYQIGLLSDASRRRRFEKRLSAVSDALQTFLDRTCAGPSLVHGDLWSGNVLCSDNGSVWLIDPAVHCADREVDIAMTELFGGFAADFYTAYTAVLPLSPEYAQKRAIYNLYHYLNHLNLFGEAYLRGCEEGFAAIDAVVARS